MMKLFLQHSVLQGEGTNFYKFPSKLWQICFKQGGACGIYAVNQQ